MAKNPDSPVEVRAAGSSTKAPPPRSETGASGGAQDDSAYLVFDTSLPDQLKRHDISDEELDMLAQWRPDKSWEILLAAFGVFLGSATPAIASFVRAYVYTPAQPLSLEGLIHVVFFVGSLIAMAICWHSTRRRKDAVEEKVGEIRTRKRKKTGAVPVNADVSSKPKPRRTGVRAGVPAE